MTRDAVAATLASTVLLDEDEIYRLSIDDVVKMYDVGILDETDRVELIDGVLVKMSPPTETHSRIVAWLNRHFVRAFPDLEVRVQDGLQIEGGYVAPDLMVIDPHTLPTDANERLRTALFVIEVCLTSQRRDRMKALRYARAGVAEYWIIDVPARNTFVHWDARETGYDVILGQGFGVRLQPRIGGPELDTAELLRMVT